MSRVSFKEQVLRVREDAIVASVIRLLAEKGFDLMTVDEVAADVGIAKASLYKHFSSKEELAAAAMVRLLDQALAFLDTLPPGDPPLQRLRAVVRWTLQVQLAGEMPTLPSQNSSLRAALGAHKDYLDRLLHLSDRLGAWITEAQDDGTVQRDVPPEVVLYTLFARACDPVLSVLRMSGQYDDDRIIEWLLSTTFDGLRGRA